MTHQENDGRAEGGAPGLFSARRIFDGREIWTYALVGLAAIAVLFGALWDENKFLHDPWTANRVTAALAAMLYGAGLGWMLWPRTLSGRRYPTASE